MDEDKADEDEEEDDPDDDGDESDSDSNSNSRLAGFQASADAYLGPEGGKVATMTCVHSRRRSWSRSNEKKRPENEGLLLPAAAAAAVAGDKTHQPRGNLGSGSGSGGSG